MTQIDTSKWGKFRVGDLFTVYLGDYNNPKFLTEDENGIPLVSATAINNGISGYYKKTPDLKVITKNKITWGKQCPYFYYQTTDFITGQGNYYLDVSALSFYTSLFICAVLNNEISQKYDYNNCLIGKKLSEEIILLPITTKGSPDWQFMENYMKEITKLATKRVGKLKEEKPQTKIDTSNWKKFEVGELFECNIAKSLDFGKLEKGDTIFIGRTSTNNGVQGKVNAPPCEKGNCITVGMVGDNKAFYQPQEFAASQNILVLRNKRLNEKNGLFFAALINSLLAKYNYSNTVKKKEFINESILLPITPEGTPDFDYMEDYMKNLETIPIKIVEKLKEEKNKTKIDTSKWGKFRVGDLFETFHGERLKKSDRIEGSTPFVTAGSENQGVADYIVTEKKYSNAITIDMFGNCFYHDGTLFGDDNIYFLISNNISKHSKLFITTIINSTLKEKYSFSHQFRQKDLDTLTINLPSTPDNFPDWQYMENYMKEITKLGAKRVEKPKEENTEYKIDTKGWGKFKVGDLFEFDRGKESAPNKNKEGDCPLIIESGENNGYSRNVEPTKIFNGNAITVSVNYASNVFYQEKNFCASVNIIILRNEHLTKNIGMFIAGILSKSHSKYNYNNKISRDKLFNEYISIPVTPNMTPDW